MGATKTDPVVFKGWVASLVRELESRGIEVEAVHHFNCEGDEEAGLFISGDWWYVWVYDEDNETYLIPGIKPRTNHLLGPGLMDVTIVARRIEWYTMRQEA